MNQESEEQLNVLVIEDDPFLCDLLVTIITADQHQAVPASSAEAGLELLPFWTFQLAFIDHNLPGIEGLMLGEYLRRNNPDMTIALVTGEIDPKLENRCRELDMQFIGKPFELSDIRRVIEDCIVSEKEREQLKLYREEPEYDPPIVRFYDEVSEYFDSPHVPSRIEERLVKSIKQSLNNLRTTSRYSERDRVMMFSGLIAAQVLGLDLPKTSAGRTLFEEYDNVMRAYGRRTEFDPDGDS